MAKLGHELALSLVAIEERVGDGNDVAVVVHGRLLRALRLVGLLDEAHLV